MQNYYAKEVKQIFKELKTSEKGISKEEAKKRLAKHGPNTLKETHKLQPIKIFFSQFNSFLIYILVIASVISFLIGHALDGIVIAAIVILNSIIGFVQQYKAETAIRNLKKLVIPKTMVIREGIAKEIPSSRLVPGDIILFKEGDKISADCRIIEAENLQTNEAVLTGESLPVNKSLETLKKNISLIKQKNMLFTGTQVVKGTSKAVVVYTGMNTFFGGIAESLQDIKVQKTPMQKRLDNFSKQIGFIILGFVAVIVLLGLFEAFGLIEMFLVAVALAVSAIPEGLPAVLTVSFAIGSLLMSRNNVIIRRLPAVESLGSVTVICSDKTGTMTEEKTSVLEIFSNNNIYKKIGKKLQLKKKVIDLKKHKELSKLVRTSVLCNNARFELTNNKYEIFGDPTEAALISASLDFGLNKKLMIEAEPSYKKFEFSSERKMMSIVRDNKRNKILYAKGAIEKILQASTHELIENQIKKIDENRKKQLREAAKKMEKNALRVLAFAYKNFASKEKIQEKGLIFLGFVGMMDPPRKEVKNAIKQCKDAGIKVKMITGDSAATAVAVANQIGITGKVLVGEELEKMTDSVLFDSIQDIGIFARTTPNQKLRITTVLQKKGEVVAMTGDGVNDSLALKAADIGVAMGKRGTDVSREVSDIILIDDNFASIVKGVEQGRKTYDNIKKFTKYFLSVNFSEIFLILTALLLAMFFGSDTWFLPLLPLQILWINLITDSLPALALVFEKQEDVMNTKPRKEKSILDGIWKFIIIAGVLTFAVKMIVYLIGIFSDFSPEKTRTIVLMTAIIFELLFVYTCRTKKPLHKIGFFSNKYLNYAVLLAIILNIILLYTPLGAIFNVVPLGISDWLLVMPFAIVGLLAFEVAKLIKNKKFLQSNKPDKN